MNFSIFLQTILKRKKLLIALSLIFIAAIGLTVWFAPKLALTHPVIKSSAVNSNVPPAAIQAIGEEPIKQLGILFLGYGGAGHQGGMLSDVIQLVYLDAEKQTITLISIPRDLWVGLPTGQEAKINTAFSLGSGEDVIMSGGQVAKHMAATVTGLPSNYFVAVDFVGFQRLIGQDLKGIEVEVSETLDDQWYPIKGEELNICDYTPEEVAELSAKYSGFELEKQFTCRYEHILFKPGTNHMEGGDALKYVRSRHGSAGGDFSRSQRQHEVLQAIGKKLISLDALKNVEEIFKTVTGNVTTDLDLGGAIHLAAQLPNLPNFQIKTITLSTENVFTSSKSSAGAYIVIPKAGVNQWTQVHQYIQSQLATSEKEN